MSKTTLRKAIKDFEAPELRELLIDVYTKSKEARELLDFFAEPDIEKKAETYRAQLTKEATRFTRHAHHPRITKLRAAIKRFQTFEPGSEAVADLMVHTSVELISLGRDGWLRERLYVQIQKFIAETLDYLLLNNLLDDFLPRIRRAAGQLERIGAFGNPMKRITESEINRIETLRDEVK
ncbi:MAG: hypothetical protein K2J28_05200 [Duncaniella sp.]|nr:hypothetical protein [Duncaniella sp.]